MSMKTARQRRNGRIKFRANKIKKQPVPPPAGCRNMAIPYKAAHVPTMAEALKSRRRDADRIGRVEA